MIIERLETDMEADKGMLKEYSCRSTKLRFIF